MYKMIFFLFIFFPLASGLYAQTAEDEVVKEETPLIIPLPLTQPLPGTNPPLPLPESLLAPPSKNLNRLLPGTVPPVPLPGTPTIPPDETQR